LRRIPEHIALPLRFFYAAAGYVEVARLDLDADEGMAHLHCRHAG
jgi:hypothetical protein